MSKRQGRALRMLLFTLWGLWVLYLGAFVTIQIQRYRNPDHAPSRSPFMHGEFRYAPPTPAMSLALFGVLGFVIPGTIYLVPRALRRKKKGRTPRKGSGA